MGKTILTASQRQAIEILRTRKEIVRVFYLTGGTALAEFYFRHRFSDDLDFFTDSQEFPQTAVETSIEEIRKTLGAKDVRHQRLYDRRLFYVSTPSGELKIEFSYYPFARLRRSQEKMGLAVDSLEDIAANKLHALFDRIESKDFVDLYFILTETGMSVSRLKTLFIEKFHVRPESITLGSEFAKVRRLELLPKMIKPITLEELKRFFGERAKELAPEIFKS